eukprot:jgi/Chrzof1/5042/Cz15g09180.t1
MIKQFHQQLCCVRRCEQRFDMRNLRALRTKHYCGRCQQVFCLQHTAYSSHGPGGSCGQESRCVCINCFYEFTPEYRALLMARNTLPSKRSISGPSAPSSTEMQFSADDFEEGIQREAAVTDASPEAGSSSAVAGGGRGSAVTGLGVGVTAVDKHHAIGPNSPNFFNHTNGSTSPRVSDGGRKHWGHGLQKVKAVIGLQGSTQRSSAAAHQGTAV